MIKKSSDYKNAIVILVTTMLVQAVPSTIFFANQKAFASTLTQNYISTDKSHEASKIDFPGSKKPGIANASNVQQGFQFNNDAIKVNFERKGEEFKITSIEDKLNSKQYQITMNSLFNITLENDVKVSPSDMTIKQEPVLKNLQVVASGIRLADRDAGKAMTTVFNYNKNGVAFDLEWNVVLRDNSNSIEQSFKFKYISGNVQFKNTKLINLSINTEGVTPKKENKDWGSPIIAKDIFMGIENPLASVTVDGENVNAEMKSKDSLKQGSDLEYTVGIGVAPEGQMKRAFRYYVERERMHFRRPQLMYNTWWTFPMNRYDDKNSDSNIPSVQPREADLDAAFKMYGQELGSRGINVDVYQIDDGWDNIDKEPVWSFHNKSLPNEFKKLKQTANNQQGQLGVWMSPFGGYGGRDRRVNANFNNYKLRNVDLFSLADKNYYNRFKDVVFNMIDVQGVNCFKFDGVGDGLRSSGPGENTYLEYENLLQLMIEVREHKPDVFIYVTVGSWASPYWLWFTDSVWRDEDDQGISGQGTGTQEASGFQDRERWINYRDNSIYKHNVKENPMMLINELMTHGITYSTNANYSFNNNFNQEYVRQSLFNDMKMLFALGGSLGELHIQKDQVEKLTVDQRKLFWDEIAKNIKWGQQNFSLLSDNQWVGGVPNSGEVYGYASWSKEKAILSLRNPSNKSNTFTLDLQKVFNLPNDAVKTYLFTERDGVKTPFKATARKNTQVILKPFEVLIFEVVPSTADQSTGTEETEQKTETRVKIDASEIKATATS